MQSSNTVLARLLREVAAALLLKNESRFRIIAYERAAEVIEQYPQDVRAMWESGRLDEVPGIGESLTKHLQDYFTNGHAKHFDSVMKGIPPATYVLMDIPGIGAKKAFKLATEFELDDPKKAITKLRKIAESGKVAELEGFGRQSATLLMESIDRFVASQQSEKRLEWPIALGIANAIMDLLRTSPEVVSCDAMGSLRRGVATIGDIDIVCVARDEDTIPQILDLFNSYEGTMKVDNRGEKKSSIIVHPGVRVDLRIVMKEQYGAMLQYFTGSKNHNIMLREYALKRGCSLSEYGIKVDGKLLGFDTEEKFYKYIGLDWVPPELREGTDEIKHAREHTLPKLVTLKDIRGDMHTHSSYDLKPSHDLGAHTYQEMVEYARGLGYEYIGFSDHNPKTSGLTSQEIVDIMKARHDYIKRHIKDFHAFISLEVDITPSGELALPEAAFEYVDCVIASLHSAFTLERAHQTKRIMRALAHPKVRIMGHPTGRLLNKRDGVTADWPEVYRLASDRGIALEINSAVERLDLPDGQVREAREMGVGFVISTDAHAREAMSTMQNGVTVARRGWCTPTDVRNTLTATKFAQWLKNGHI